MVIFGVRPDPEPEQAVIVFGGQRTIAAPDTSGPEAANFLEIQRRMIRVALQKLKILVGQLLYFGRKAVIGLPEAGRREVLHSFLARPA